MDSRPNAPQVSFAIIEVADGLTVVEVQPGQSPEEVASLHDGMLIDAGPYPTYDEAQDALLNIPDEDEEEAY